MHTMNIHKRLTFKYTDAYRDLDRHVLLGTVRLTPPRQTRAPVDFDDGGTYVRFATLPVRLDARGRREARRAIAENLSKWACKHEYDCCGCELTRTVAYPTRDPRRVLLVTNVSYNY